MSELLDLQGRHWLSRGHPKRFNCLVPSIDRDGLVSIPRADKLARERSSIEIFRQTARYLASTGEQAAVADDVIALMVLRHYAVPTRLLDWSRSPLVAAYFSVSTEDKTDGEIWAFDYFHYEEMGKQQWRRWPETTRGSSGDDDKFEAGLTAFKIDEPPDWIIAAFNPLGFPRQNAPRGAYTMAARFERDHAELLSNLLKDKSRLCQYLVPAKLKLGIREILLHKYGIWQGALFPDAAGAAATAKGSFSGK